MVMQSGIKHMLPKIGDQAPNFRLALTAEQTLTLHHFHGQPVVLVFHPFNWDPVSEAQLTLYQAWQDRLAPFNATLIAISVDNVWCQLAFARHHRLAFPLLSDFHPKGAVSQRYGIYNPATGASDRAIFVLDADGTIRWQHHVPSRVNPGVDGILTALEQLAHPGERAADRPVD